MDAQAQIERLRNEIRQHDYHYYVLAQPKITDLEYDGLLEKLKALESKHPQLITPDSPTQRIGDAPVAHLTPARHLVPMLSIDNTYSADEVRKYADRATKLLDGLPIEWVVELKIDGAAVSIIYENGLLTRGLTRGDGKTGDDVTHNLRTIPDVPLRLIGTSFPDVLEVRGELYMTNDDLVRLNELQKQRDEPPYANPRNSVAGSIRLLDPRICAERKLRLFCHSVGDFTGIGCDDHMSFLRTVESYGLPVTPHVKCLTSIEAALAYCDELIEKVPTLEFEIDGIVLKVNRFDQRGKLGTTSKSPRWAIAYKFEKYEATTLLNAIRVQIGKAGTITPVAELEPVELAGTTVSRASLHNADEIARKDIRVGDVVVVEKAGKIIPHIVRVEKHERKSDLPPFVFPVRCPECDSKLVKDERGVYIRCPNFQCPAQVKERIRYFASRHAMDIEGLGDKIVDHMVSHGLVSAYADLYRLTAKQLSQLERLGEISSQKLVARIAESKDRGLARLLNALSIRHVGTRVATILADRFGSIEALSAATVEEISRTNDIGEAIANSVYDFLHNEFGKSAVAQLIEVGVKTTHDSPVRPATARKLEGKSFVVTGTLSKLSRDEIHELIERHGGKHSSSVSSKTEYLVAGDKAGSKLEKANSLGIKIISEDEFLALIEDG